MKTSSGLQWLESQALPRGAHGNRPLPAHAKELPTLPIDRLVLELMANAKHVKEIQVVHGLTPGNVTKALEGEHVGTIISVS